MPTSVISDGKATIEVSTSATDASAVTQPNGFADAAAGVGADGEGGRKGGSAAGAADGKTWPWGLSAPACGSVVGPVSVRMLMADPSLRPNDSGCRNVLGHCGKTWPVRWVAALHLLQDMHTAGFEMNLSIIANAMTTCMRGKARDRVIGLFDYAVESGLIDTGSYKTRLIAYQCVFRACSLKQDGALAVKYWKLFKFQTSMTPKLVPDAKLYRCVLSRPFPPSSLPPPPPLSLLPPMQGQ